MSWDKGFYLIFIAHLPLLSGWPQSEFKNHSDETTTTTATDDDDRATRQRERDTEMDSPPPRQYKRQRADEFAASIKTAAASLRVRERAR